MGALAAGGAFGVPMVMPMLWPLAFVALAAGIRFVQDAPSHKRALTLGYLFGLGFCSVSLSFLLLAYPTDWLGLPNAFHGAVVVLGVWMLCTIPLPLALAPWVVAVRLLRMQPLPIQVLLSALAWVASEYIRSVIATAVLWAPGLPIGPHIGFTLTGLSLSGSDGLLWAGYLGGFWALAFVAYVLAALLLEAWRFTAVRVTYRTWLFVTLCVVIVLSYTVPPALHTTFGVASVAIDEAVTVALVHTDFPRSAALSPEEKTEKAQMLSRKIVSAAAELRPGDVILLPEDSRFFEFSAYLNGYERTRARDALKANSITLIDSGRHAEWDGTYSVVAIEFPGTSTPPLRFHKTLLAAFGEYLPFMFEFVWKLSGSEDARLAYERTRLYVPAREEFLPSRHTFTVGSTRFGILACSEVLSTTLYPLLGKESDVLLNISSLAAGKGSPLMFNQFLAMAKVHAVVARKPYLQATNFEPNLVIVPKLSHTRISY